MLYVALTRTTTYLDIVHVGDPLPGYAEPPPQGETTPPGPSDPWSNLLAALGAEAKLEGLEAVPEQTPSIPSAAVTGQEDPMPAQASIPSAGAKPLSARVTEMLAEDISRQIREAAPEPLWAPVLDRVAELLGQTKSPI